MINKRWNIGDWVLCTNVEPMEEGRVIGHHPSGEFVTVKTYEGNEYFYPESSDLLALITVEPEYTVDPDEITDIDTFFLHIVAAPKEISGVAAKEFSAKAMKLTNVHAKEKILFFLSLAPTGELHEKWKKRARILSNDCYSSADKLLELARSITGPVDKKPVAKVYTPTNSSNILN
jgi:hypothetical protein